MNTATKTAEPRIASVTFKRGEQYNSINMAIAHRTVITFTDGSTKTLYGDEAREFYNRWNDDLRTVSVVQRSADGWNVSIVNISLRWTCPVCGGPRGEPVNRNFCEDGEWYTCDAWYNPCGHVDMYRDVLKECRDLYEAVIA